MKVCIKQTLDRNKVLDEAIFLTICGLNQLKEGSKITGLVRLEIAQHKLNHVIEKLKEK